MHEDRITVGELVARLANYPPDTEIIFSDGLPFYRLKTRGDRLVQIEFNVTVFREPDGNWRVEPFQTDINGIPIGD